jgi:nucleoside-diphosphate-sugar epimerase
MILVTGSSGRVGSKLVDALVKQNEKVRTFEKKDSESKVGVEAVQGDILDPEAVKKAVEGVDVIYHLAAMVDYYPVPKDIMYNVNVIGTKNML